MIRVRLERRNPRPAATVRGSLKHAPFPEKGGVIVRVDRAMQRYYLTPL